MTTCKQLAISFTLLCFFLTGKPANGQDSIRLVFIGDVMQHMPQINGAKYGNSYCYDSCFSYVASRLSNADITIANLELTLAGKPYSGYPCFSAPDAIAQTLKNVGVDLLATANNHSCDKGKNGIIRTLDVLDSLQIPHTGTFRNISEKLENYPYLLEKNGFRFSILCYTYDTNGIPIPSPTEVNLIDTSAIAMDIALAKLQNPDAIIAIMHWGNEYQRTPSAEQKALADFLAERGVKLVIGSHPHVVQPMELRKSPCSDMPDKAIVYSLGNFVSNQEAKHTDGGAIAYLTLVRKNGSITIADASYSLVWVYKPIENGIKRYYILPVEDFENKSDFFKPTDYTRFMQFTKDTRLLLQNNNNGFFERNF